MAPQGSKRTVYLLAVPLYVIWVNSGHFGPEKGGKTSKKTSTEERLIWSSFQIWGTLFKPNFLSPPRSKMKNFSAHQTEDGLRISKIPLLLFLVQFLGELWPLKHKNIFFGTPCTFLSHFHFQNKQQLQQNKSVEI